MQYWIDKSAHQPFDSIGRVDLIFAMLLEDTGSAYLTPSLVAEYTASGKLTADAHQNAFGVKVVSMDGSEYDYSQQQEYRMHSAFTANDVNQTLELHKISVSSPADAEGIYVNLALGFITLTNDTNLINKIGSITGSSPCFRPSQILAANVMAGLLTNQEAEEVWIQWKNINQRYVPSNYDSFAEYNSSFSDQDRNLLREYFRT